MIQAGKDWKHIRVPDVDVAPHGGDPLKVNHAFFMMPFDCHKRRHATLAGAVRAIRDMKRRPWCRDPERLNAYWCEGCSAYHVGHAGYSPRRA